MSEHLYDHGGEGAGPCKKQTVTARIVAADGSVYEATNYCRNPQPNCPRSEAGYKTGEGYHLCTEVCDQPGHAEENAVRLAGDMAQDAVMYLSGHYYACEPCQAKADEAGIREIVVAGDGNE